MKTLREVPQLQKRTSAMEVDKVDLRIMEDDILEIVGYSCLLERYYLLLFDRHAHITSNSWVATSSAYVGTARQPHTTPNPGDSERGHI
jgi:hypothetical protein